MINTIRPKAIEFQPHLGSDYQVISSENGESGATWVLKEVSMLEVPPIESLQGEDCFILIFESAGTHDQGWFELQGPDGLKKNLVATPTYSDSGKGAMQVVIN